MCVKMLRHTRITFSFGSAKYVFGKWKNCNPCCVTVKCLYRSNYILPTTLSQILSDVESWAQVFHLFSDIKQTALSLFISGVEKNSISKCSAVCVYSNTRMIISVRIIPGVKIASLG